MRTLFFNTRLRGGFLLSTSWALAKAKGGKRRQNEKGSYFW
jgi:hypothetical protein